MDDQHALHTRGCAGASSYLERGCEQMASMYGDDLLRVMLSYGDAVAASNVEDMAAFYVEQKAYTDIIEHTRDLLSGGIGYQCWISVEKKQNYGRFASSTVPVSVCSSRALSAIEQRCQNSSRPGSSMGHYSREPSYSVYAKSPRSHHSIPDLQRRSRAASVPAPTPCAGSAVQRSPLGLDRPSIITSECSYHVSEFATPTGLCYPAATGSAAKSTSAGMSPVNLFCNSRDFCSNGDCLEAPYEMDFFPGIEPLPGVPSGAAYLVSSAAAAAARQNILHQIKLREQLQEAQNQRMVIKPQAINRLAQKYKTLLNSPIGHLATATGHLTLAQKRTYADNYITSEWMLEPWVYGSRRRASIRKRDILNPWDRKKPALKAPGESAFSKQGPSASQIAPGTLAAAKADASAAAKLDAVAAVQQRAVAAEQYAGQVVPHGKGWVHRVMFHCSRAVAVAAARAGLLKVRMENAVGDPAKPGSLGYQKPPAAAESDAVEIGWNGPRSEASCMRMDELRLMLQMQQLHKQEKRIKAQLAFAKLGGLFNKAEASNSDAAGSPPISTVSLLEKQLRSTAASQQANQKLLQQIRHSLKGSSNSTADQCVSLDSLPRDLWEDESAAEAADATMDHHCHVDNPQAAVSSSNDPVAAPVPHAAGSIAQAGNQGCEATAVVVTNLPEPTEQRRSGSLRLLFSSFSSFKVREALKQKRASATSKQSRWKLAMSTADEADVIMQYSRRRRVLKQQQQQEHQQGVVLVR